MERQGRSEHLGKLMELLEGAKLPEGLYLQACDLMKKIYDDTPTRNFGEESERRNANLWERVEELEMDAVYNDRLLLRLEGQVREKDVMIRSLEDRVKRLEDRTKRLEEEAKRDEEYVSELRLRLRMVTGGNTGKDKKKKPTESQKRGALKEFLREMTRFKEIKMFQKKPEKFTEQAIEKMTGVGLSRLFNRIFVDYDQY